MKDKMKGKRKTKENEKKKNLEEKQNVAEKRSNLKEPSSEEDAESENETSQERSYREKINASFPMAFANTSSQKENNLENAEEEEHEAKNQKQGDLLKDNCKEKKECAEQEESEFEFSGIELDNEESSSEEEILSDVENESKLENLDDIQNLTKSEEMNYQIYQKNSDEAEKKHKFNEEKDNCNFAQEVFWCDMHLSRPILKALAKLGFDAPTEIQKKVIPLTLQGFDVLATAETGSGKTAAFLLPVLERLLLSPVVAMRRFKSTCDAVSKVLVLSPTRELAVQTFQVLNDLSQFTLITKTLVCGGINLKAQELSLRNQPDIIVATTGRILDHLINSKSVHVEMLEIVIFDEADRLMELGFKEECLQIIKRCSKDRQSLLLSATLCRPIEEFAQLALRNPVYVHATVSHKIVSNLVQQFVLLENENLREAALLYLCLNSYKSKKKIIFLDTKRSVHRISLIFQMCDLQCVELHGNLSQNERLKALEKFHTDAVNTLIASELASRGLDIPGVDAVINFCIPSDLTRYIHRVGRTARMGRDGEALTFYLKSEKKNVKQIVKLTNKTLDSTKNEKEKDVMQNNDKYTFLNRKISSQRLAEYKANINSLEKRIKMKIQEEKVEKELQLAEMEKTKIQNMITYRDEIDSRPNRTWFLSQHQKTVLKENSQANEKEKHTKQKKCGSKGESKAHRKMQLKQKNETKEHLAVKLSAKSFKKNNRIKRFRVVDSNDSKEKNNPFKTKGKPYAKFNANKFMQKDKSKETFHKIIKKKNKRLGHKAFKSKKKYKRRK